MMTSENARFFKTGEGEYAAHDQFLGWTVPQIRKMAKEQLDLPFKELTQLLKSPYNEKRLLALIILVHQYKNTSKPEKVYEFYLKHKQYVNNWNLVDASAHLIIGAHLFDQKDKRILIELSESESLWDRRIAIVSTWYFIKNDKLEWTFKLAKLLLNDAQDLIHKATGWMLREAGKKDKAALVTFLNQYSGKMPRTMLRYAIEKFDQDERLYYLKGV